MYVLPRVHLPAGRVRFSLHTGSNHAQIARTRLRSAYLAKGAYKRPGNKLVHAPLGLHTAIQGLNCIRNAKCLISKKHGVQCLLHCCTVISTGPQTKPHQPVSNFDKHCFIAGTLHMCRVTFAEASQWGKIMLSNGMVDYYEVLGVSLATQ